MDRSLLSNLRPMIRLPPSSTLWSIEISSTAWMEIGVLSRAEFLKAENALGRLRLFAEQRSAEGDRSSKDPEVFSAEGWDVTFTRDREAKLVVVLGIQRGQSKGSHGPDGGSAGSGAPA